MYYRFTTTKGYIVVVPCAQAALVLAPDKTLRVGLCTNEEDFWENITDLEILDSPAVVLSTLGGNTNG